MQEMLSGAPEPSSARPTRPVFASTNPGHFRTVSLWPARTDRKGGSASTPLAARRAIGQLPPGLSRLCLVACGFELGRLAGAARQAGHSDYFRAVDRAELS